jgi:hypothetical protein
VIRSVAAVGPAQPRTVTIRRTGRVDITRAG